MLINIKSGIDDSFLPSGLSTQKFKSSNDIFAKHLESQMNQTGEIASDHKNERTNRFSGDIASIKEKGLTAYVMELEAKKREELRAEILACMGLTEEDLSKLPPEARALIEKIVSEKIQERLTASSLKNKDDETGADQSMPDHIMPGIKPGLVFLSIVEEKDATDSVVTIKEKDDR